MKNTHPLKDHHHDFNIERFKSRLTAKSCVIFIILIQIVVRMIGFFIQGKLSTLTKISYIVGLPLNVLTALIVVFEYLLYRRIGSRVMNYSRLIDILLLIVYTTEWLATLCISLTGFGNMNPPALPVTQIFNFASFGWRILFFQFLIQGWKLISIPPILASSLMIGFALHYSPTGPKLVLLFGIPPVIYTVILLYFLDKVKWREVFTNTHQERWMHINQFVLNSLPENIVVLDIGGQVNFVSDYCKVFMKKMHLSQDPKELFRHISDLSQQQLEAESELETTSNQVERMTTMHAMLDPMENTLMKVQKSDDTLEDLIESFKIFINDSHLQEREFLIYNGKLRVPDHQTKSIEIKLSFVQQYDRKNIILILRDTTHRDLLVALEDNNKYKDQLLASVSHELRAPLNGNTNLLESALQDKDVPVRVKEQLLIPALRSSRFLLHIINDILDLSQIKVQKLRLIFKSANLQETLKDTMQLVELQAKKKGIELSLVIHPNIKDTLYTDHIRLSQIVLNLLNNAIKFTQKGQVILSVTPSDDPDCLKITVQDSGMGITQENMKKLFSNYTHIDFADREAINPTGVGLGLKIAYSLAKLLGPVYQQGITVESVPGEGSTFSFLVENKHNNEDVNEHEIVKDSSASGQVADEFEVLDTRISSKMKQILSTNIITLETEPHPASDSRCTCPKILTVDDNPFNTMAFEAVIGSLGYKCESVFDGRTAVEKILQRQNSCCGANCKPYRVVFMDQEMPGMTGSETVEEIRKLQVQGLVPEMKIIGCTAHGSTKEVDKFMASGLDMCIHKPIIADEISKILKDQEL